MGIDISKYQDMDEGELIQALERDGLIVLEAPDTITGEPLFTLTPAGVEAFEMHETREEAIAAISKEVYALWQHGMVDVEFSPDGHAEDAVTLTEDAYDVEKVLVLPREVQVYLATIKRTFEKTFENDDI